MFFQSIPAKDKITFTNKEGKKKGGSKIRFRNGFCSEVLTSVDIQEIVTAGERIIRILDGIVYEENFKTPPYRDYILILRDLKNKYKREAPKVKYNIILTSDEILKEKKTFKGHSNDKIIVEDYIRLASGHDVTNEFKKRWKTSFTNGVVIPKDDDKQKLLNFSLTVFLVSLPNHFPNSLTLPPEPFADFSITKLYLRSSAFLSSSVFFLLTAFAIPATAPPAVAAALIPANIKVGEAVSIASIIFITKDSGFIF
ncbi:hypothetical protein LOTGIDRAFT_164103 [Lottia gigantea]|uniref:Uncharacterized protein n=1 Tax=Lottia gigantea TaxID=225164 RepID=V4BNQ4_LOTGI|nr:hypothetical protein LOTGIDRAFT_164103 [Lottia gigantea]ESO90514.1 hypothetical protein LOTGIDRAFT_164103 [Lottia gigantea]